MSINKVILELRKSKNWSQEIMAEKLGMSKNNYARLERGEVQIKYNRLEQIANLFQIDILKLVEAGYKGVVIQQTIDVVGLENHTEQSPPPMIS